MTDTVRLHELQGRVETTAYPEQARKDIRALLGLTREMAAIIADLANAYNAYVREGEVDAIRARNVLSRLADGASE